MSGTTCPDCHGAGGKRARDGLWLQCKTCKGSGSK